MNETNPTVNKKPAFWPDGRPTQQTLARLAYLAPLTYNRACPHCGHAIDTSPAEPLDPTIARLWEGVVFSGEPR